MKKFILSLILFPLSLNSLEGAAAWLPKGDGLFNPLLADPEEVQITGKYFTLFHKSAHLGDNYIDRTKQPRITYSREGIQWIGAMEPVKFLRVYSGATWLLHTIPQLDRAEIQAGLELHGPYFHFIPNHLCYLYLNQDLQSKQEAAGTSTAIRSLACCSGSRILRGT